MNPRIRSAASWRPQTPLLHVMFPAALAIGLVGCSSSEGVLDSASTTESSALADGESAAIETGSESEASDQEVPPEFDVDEDSVSLAEDGLIFRDPAATGEFAPVAEEPALDLSPEALPEVDEPELPEPEEAVEAVVEDLVEVDLAAPEPGQERLDLVEAIDDGPSAGEQAERDGHRRNELGELVVLDAPADLACAGVERALTSLDERDRQTAETLIDTASTDAGASAVEEVASWAGPLDAGFGTDEELPVLIGFLSVCAKGGYEL